MAEVKTNVEMTEAGCFAITASEIEKSRFENPRLRTRSPCIAYRMRQRGTKGFVCVVPPAYVVGARNLVATGAIRVLTFALRLRMGPLNGRLLLRLAMS
jgi:hypothetical protein